MKCEIVFESQTGNTRVLAKELYERISCEKEIQELSDETSAEQGDIYFVGFWTDRGSCSMNVIDFLSRLQGKHVALFGTCGMGNNRDYFSDIENRVKVWIPEDNHYMGCYMCQGKMPIQVRKKYEAMLEAGEQPAFAEKMLKNFDEAMLHPDEADFNEIRKFANDILNKIQF